MYYKEYDIYIKETKGKERIGMAVRDYREMYIATILTLGKEKGLTDEIYKRSYLANLTLDELKELAEKAQG